LRNIVLRKSDTGLADFNTFIDEILELIAPALIEQQIALPDLFQEFEQGVLFVTLHGSAEVFLRKYYTHTEYQ
jgi:hypothetical protein